MRDYIAKPSLKNPGYIGLIILAAIMLFGVINWAVAGKAHAEGPVASFYIGAHAGGSLANSALSGGGVSFVDGLGAESKSPIFGARGGVDFQLPGSIVFLGAFATYTVQDVEFSAFNSAFTASLKNSWSAGGRAGVKVGNAKPYVLLAYRNTDMEWTDLGQGPAPTLKGYDLGAGLSYAIDKNLDLGIEGVWTKYQSQDLCGGCGFNMDTDQLSVMAFLNFKIGGPEPAAATKGPARQRLAP